MDMHSQPGDLLATSGGCGCGLFVRLGEIEQPPERLIAFVPEFSWAKSGANATVRLNPGLSPSDEAAGSYLRKVIEAGLLAGKFYGGIAPGVYFIANA